MTFSTYTTHIARKPHRCEYCQQTIPVGERYVHMAGKWEGEFYSGSGHMDCRDLWRALYDDWAEDEGMRWDIGEVFADSEEIGCAKEALDAYRGHFPHAVNRIEFRLQDWLIFDEDDE